MQVNKELIFAMTNGEQVREQIEAAIAIGRMFEVLSDSEGVQFEIKMYAGKSDGDKTDLHYGMTLKPGHWEMISNKERGDIEKGESGSGLTEFLMQAGFPPALIVKEEGDPPVFDGESVDSFAQELYAVLKVELVKALIDEHEGFPIMSVTPFSRVAEDYKGEKKIWVWTKDGNLKPFLDDNGYWQVDTDRKTVLFENLL